MSDRNILKLDDKCVVVIRRGGRAYTKSFAHRRFDSRQKALREARAWRDRMVGQLAPAGRWRGPRERPLAGKQSRQPVGVSEHISRDGRLRFTVNWTDEDGRTRIKTFSAGQVATASRAQIKRVERAARRFRKAFEASKAGGKPFDPEAHA